MTATTGPCEGCTDGVLVGFTYGVVDLPAGVVPIQRCDVCARFASDEQAAIALARQWGATWGVANDPSRDDNTPGECWVSVPDTAFDSESAATQAWIDGDAVPCSTCGSVLGRRDGAWHHLAPTGEPHDAAPRIAPTGPKEDLRLVGARPRTGDDDPDADLGLYWVEHREDPRGRWTRPEQLPVTWLDAVGQLRHAAASALVGTDPDDPDDISAECRDVLRSIDKGMLATAQAPAARYTGRYIRIVRAGLALADPLAAQLRWWVVLSGDGYATVKVVTTSGTTVQGTLDWHEIEPDTVTIVNAGRHTVVRTDRIESFTLGPHPARHTA